MRHRILERIDWTSKTFDDTWEFFRVAVEKHNERRMFDAIRELVPKKDVGLYALVFHIVELVVAYEQQVKGYEFKKTILCEFMDDYHEEKKEPLQCFGCCVMGNACYPTKVCIKAALRRYRKLYLAEWNRTQRGGQFSLGFTWTKISMNGKKKKLKSKFTCSSYLKDLAKRQEEHPDKAKIVVDL